LSDEATFFKPSSVLRPKTIEEACQLLKGNDGRIRIVAGNTTLYELGVHGGLAGVESIMDISRLGLDYIRRDEETHLLMVGASSTFSDIAYTSPITISDSYFALKEVSSKITPRQIRNFGTIGGSTCSGIPFYDMPTVLLALQAKMKVASAAETKLFSANDFFIDYFTTALSPEELLVEIQLQNRENSGSAFLKLGRTAVDFSIVNTCARMQIDKLPSGKVKTTDVAVSLGAVSNTPIRASGVEEVLLGREISDELIIEASKKISDLEPTASIQASSEYKKKIIPVLVRDALRVALGRAIQSLNR
jgi:aerobic carbon-monoxide dehydrogenase medium subunit